MVGPIPEDERRDATRRVAAGFATFVAISAGLMAYRSGATLPETGLVVVAGLAFGVALLLVLTGRF